MDICICTTDSLCCTPETNNIVINYTPIKIFKNYQTNIKRWYPRTEGYETLGQMGPIRAQPNEWKGDPHVATLL